MSTRRASIRKRSEAHQFEELTAVLARSFQKRAIALSFLGLSLCVATSAEEAADRDCAEAAASRVRTVPGAVIKELRSGEAALFMGAPADDRSFRVEVDITSSSINATYVFICKPKPGREPDLDLIGIH